MNIGGGAGGPLGKGFDKPGLRERNFITTDLTLISQEDRSAIENSLRSLGSVFGRYGSCELKGRHTGQDREGEDLLQWMAYHLGVPVSAGNFFQLSNPFKFDDKNSKDKDEHSTEMQKTKTAFPGGVSLESWCRSLPDFPRQGEAYAHHIGHDHRTDRKDDGPIVPGRYRRAMTPP